MPQTEICAAVSQIYTVNGANESTAQRRGRGEGRLETRASVHVCVQESCTLSGDMWFCVLMVISDERRL